MGYHANSSTHKNALSHSSLMGDRREVERGTPTLPHAVRGGRISGFVVDVPAYIVG